MELGKAINYNISIEPSQNKGFIVKIGCGKFVAENVDNLLSNLSEYLHHPEEWEKKYNAISPVQPEEVPAGDTPEYSPSMPRT